MSITDNGLPSSMQDCCDGIALPLGAAILLCTITASDAQALDHVAAANRKRNYMFFFTGASTRSRCAATRDSLATFSVASLKRQNDAVGYSRWFSTRASSIGSEHTIGFCDAEYTRKQDEHRKMAEAFEFLFSFGAKQGII